MATRDEIDLRMTIVRPSAVKSNVHRHMEDPASFKIIITVRFNVTADLYLHE